jgi:hypothetical protein
MENVVYGYHETFVRFYGTDFLKYCGDTTVCPHFILIIYFVTECFFNFFFVGKIKFHLAWQIMNSDQVAVETNVIEMSNAYVVRK